jgi:hypothetical protein
MLIVVLNDGETYTDIDGCVIVDVPDEMDSEDIEMYLREGEWDGLDITAVLRVYQIIEGTV